MEGSSNQSPSQGQSVRSPSTPSSYAVNINRKKTRKWVEAKVQNYDGDDWGAPESDDEPESPPELPRLAPRPAPVGGPRLPSESRIPGAGRAPQAPILQQPQAPTKPAYERPEVGISAANHAPAISDTSMQEKGPALPTASHIPEVKEDEGPRVHGDETIPDPREDLAQDGKRVSVSPQLPNVARMSAFGADLFSGGPELPSQREPVIQEEREQTPTPVGAWPATAPKSGTHIDNTLAPTIAATTLSPTPPTNPIADPEKAPVGGVLEKSDPSTVPPPPVEPASSVSERHENPPVDQSGPAASEEPPRLRAGADIEALPPLRTSSLHETRTVSPGPVSGPTDDDDVAKPISGESTSAFPPTEPLHPKKPEYTPSDYEPQPLGRQLTHDTTTSSPIKESDVLSEEIMRSLTPGGLSPHQEHSDEKRKSQAFHTGRESGNPLSDYDDYWNETGDSNDTSQRKPTLNAVPELSAVSDVAAAGPTSTETKAPEPTSSPPPVVADPAPAYHPGRVSQPPAYEASLASQQFSPMSPESSQPGSDAGLRRRFSWEAADEARAQPAASPNPKDTTTPAAAVPQSIVQGGPATAQADPAQPAANPVSPTIKIVNEEPSTISHQVSIASSSNAPRGQHGSLGPPSPVSDSTDRNATPLVEHSPQRGASLTNVQSAPAARNFATGDADATAGAGASSQPILTFREIMNMSNPDDRITKYEETRSIFANQDSGLDDWMATLKDEHAEHANANGSFSGAMPAPPYPANTAAAAAAAPGSLPSAQQPYYQQYLNANANTASAGPAPGGTTRSRLAVLPIHGQQAAGSAFGGSGNQIGTKSKELMHSAGKMGKGLFSKGKSKLRGTGDKGEHSPPPVDRKPEQQSPHQAPSKSDRRMSWAFSLGPKSREHTGSSPAPSGVAGVPGGQVDAGPDTSSTSGGPRLSLNTEPPRLAEPPRLSPLHGGDQGDFWHAQLYASSPTTNEQRLQDENIHNVSSQREDADVAAPGPPPGSGRETAQWNPTPPNRNEHVAGVPGQDPDPDPEKLPVAETGQKPGGARDIVADTDADTPGQNDARLALLHQPVVVQVAEGSRIGMASQPQSEARPDAQRHSSFKGLPPLRRNSSFGLATFTTDSQQQDESAAPERDPPAQQGDAIAQPHQYSAHHPQPYERQNGTVGHRHPDGAISQPIDESTHRSIGVDSNATLVGQEGTNRTGRSSISINKEPMRFYQPPQGQQPMPTDAGAPQHQAHSQPHQSPGQPPAISPQPPSGWQLEESHVSEPLRVARRRAGTGSSQQQVTLGSLEKETGGTLPMTSASPAPAQETPSPHPPRGRSSDVPPSSARRYPDLFRPTSQQQQQRDRANSGGQPALDPAQGLYQTRTHVEGTQHPSSSGFEGSPAPSESRRKPSNIFKGLGGRLSGSKSNERRSSLAEQSSSPNGVQPVGYYANVQVQQPQEPKKKRSSFLPGLKPRLSHEAVNEPQLGNPHRPATQETMQPPERAQTGTPQSDTKRSFLGSAAGRVSAAQHKFIPGGLPGINRSATSYVAADSSSTAGGDASSMGGTKKRFSGFADKAAGLAGKLHRPSQEHSKPGTSQSSASSMSQLPQPQHAGAASHHSLAPPPSRSRGRSDTVGSVESQAMSPPAGPDTEGDRQGRRGSFTGAINSLWGANRSSSKTRQTEPPGPYAAPPGSHQGPEQSPMGPFGSSQGGAGRSTSTDAGSRLSRQFPAQSVPARPSPLAQHSTAQGPSSPTEQQTHHTLHGPGASDNFGRAGSPIAAPLNSPVGQQAQQRNSMHFAGPLVTGSPDQSETSRASVVSPVGSIATEEGNRASTIEDKVNRSESQRTVEDLSRTSTPQATPTSPIKRLPTPHASALLSSMAPTSGQGQPPVASLPREDSALNGKSVQESNEPGQQGYTKSNSGQTASLRSGHNLSLRKPVAQPAPVASRETTPVQTQAVPPPSDRQESPARNSFVSGLVQHPGSQSQSPTPVGFRSSPPPAGHQPSPAPERQSFTQSPPPAGSGPSDPSSGFGAPPSHNNGLSGALREPGSRQSTGRLVSQIGPEPARGPQQPSQQPQPPQGPQGPLQSPQQLYLQRGQQSAHQQPYFDNQAPSRQPAGPGPRQAGFPPQEPVRQGQFPSQQQQAFLTQGQPFPANQPTQPPQPTAGSESKLKEWKARVSSQMATITAQSNQQPLDTEAAGQAKPEKQGWKARMSAMGQLSSQNGQPKPVHSSSYGKPDKPSTGGKLLGALKKVAKPTETPPAPPPKAGQPSQQPQWRPSPVQQAQAFPPQSQHPFAPHNAYGQYAQQGRGQPGPAPNVAPPQFHQYPQQHRLSGQSPLSPPGPQSHHGQRQQQHPPGPLPGQPGQAQYIPPQQQLPQEPGQPPRQVSYGQQMAMHHAQQAAHYSPEPQYDHVPIPKSYSAVHGEGSVAPTNHHVPRGPVQSQGQLHPQGAGQGQYSQGHPPPLQQQQVPYHGQPPVPAPQASAASPVAPPYGRQIPAQPVDQNHQIASNGNPRIAEQAQSQEGRRQSTVASSPPDNGSFNLPIQGGTTPSATTPGEAPDEVSKDALQQGDFLQRPPALRHDTIMTDGGRSVESGVMGGTGQRLLPPGQSQSGHHLQAKASNMSMNVQEPSREGSVVSSGRGNTAEIPRPVSISPDADIVDQHDDKAKDLNIDVARSRNVDEENIYDATPRLDHNKTGGSDVSKSGSATSGNMGTTTSGEEAEQGKKDDPPMMELEDTAEARLRTLRLDSQEEKIFYDPEGDVPKMSATSYPGQEWNPYGEPEFGEWKEE